LIRQLLHDLDVDFEVFLHPDDEITIRLAITTVTPRLGQSWKPLTDRLEEQLRPRCFGDIRRVDPDL
jgi:hypothetical protein